MNDSGMLFEIEPRYCIDTNVILSFLGGSDDEYYGDDIFPDQWGQIEAMIAEGEIIAPRQIERELERHATKRDRLGPWLRTRGYMFRDVDTDTQLDLAKRIVNAYPAYASSDNYLGDLEVITLAGALGLSVISLEAPNQQSGQRRPKIPNICDEFGIGCMSVAGLLREIMRRNASPESARWPT